MESGARFSRPVVNVPLTTFPILLKIETVPQYYRGLGWKEVSEAEARLLNAVAPILRTCRAKLAEFTSCRRQFLPVHLAMSRHRQ